MKKALAMLMAIVMLMSFASIGAVAEANEDFTIAYNGIVTLNPIMSQSSNDHMIFYLTQAQLIRYYEGQIQLDAAIQPIYLQGVIHAVQSYVDGFSISNNGDGFAFNNMTVNK